ncbi:UvrD-helicase domain-containing protein [Paenibacillus sp. p3-SID867]|uniref:UvrD-helicase domain-containing protein n=1 Tax=Paenibacillus sp. p3-SID867 TaxID=2916363 RepID=UPI0021A68910|nr:UvrD-helicase domain-containing protein [Paenibacillus sp. p3-SID867]MCT1398499.1 UvrD-helicase domain-containing protein [Paenibacillus sp. p3-SID867]
MIESSILSMPPDQADRERILLDLDTTLLVEAGAGSGKTTSLVGRLLALIDHGVHAEQIAAITFTNKAAGELKERFRVALETANRTAEPSSMSGSRFSAALSNLDLMFIGTIHSFCGLLLRERPIEAGLEPYFEEMAEEEEKLFHAACWDEYIAELNDTQLQLYDELSSLAVNVNTLKEVYDRVSMFSDVELPCQERNYPNFDRIRETLFPLLDAAAPYIPSTEPDPGWDKLQMLVRTNRQKMQLIDLKDDMRILEIAEEFEGKINVTQKRWTSKEQAIEMKTRFLDWQQAVLLPFLQEWREYLYPKLIAFVRPAIAYCQERRLSAGRLNFQDLLLETAKLLRSHREVRTYFAQKYQRILVDEFQDTDPVQAELIFLLTGVSESILEDLDWRQLKPRPGSLFLVGDPKQSIYRFRRADISIYNEVKARIRECGTVLKLTSNFRSVPSIGEYINSRFADKFPSAETEYQAAFAKMETDWDLSTQAAGHGVHVLNYPKIAGGKAAASLEDAKRIASYISWACTDGNLQMIQRDGTSRNAVPGDFMILTKTKQFIHVYAEQLDLSGIPADTSGSTAAYEEMLMLWQLACCLEDASDQPALLAVLRGMLFGLSDQQLWAYKQVGCRISLYESISPGDLSDDAQPVGAALAKLRVYSDWVRTLSAAAAFSLIVEDLGIVPYVSALPAGSVRAGTLVGLMQLVHSDARAGSSWSELCRLMERTCKGMETSSLYAGGDQAVRVMNLHKAKGLEAAVVFLAGPCEESEHDPAQYIDRSSDPAAGYFTIHKKVGVFQSKTVAQPPGWSLMSERERTFEKAEKDRLLYVAATRAKQMLVISLYPEQPAKCPWTPLIEGMLELPELEVPERIQTPKTELTQGPDILSIRATRQRQLNDISRPTYSLLSVTEQTKTLHDRPEWSSEGKGMAFGSVVHRSLEMLGKGLAESDLEGAVHLLASEEGLAAEYIPEAVRIARSILVSELWQRSLRARRRLFELPLLLRKSTEELKTYNSLAMEDIQLEAAAASAIEDETVKHAYMRGVIDFLFEEEDGWVIVDFKTDHIEEGALQTFVNFYRPQVLVYATEWENTFGFKVKEAGLYFAGVGRYVVL